MIFLLNSLSRITVSLSTLSNWYFVCTWKYWKKHFYRDTYYKTKKITLKVGEKHLELVK